MVRKNKTFVLGVKLRTNVPVQCVCVCVIRQTLRYKVTWSERNRDVRDKETVMSTPVESDKRDRELVDVMSPPAWRWHVGGMERKREGRMNNTIPVENREINRGRLDP